MIETLPLSGSQGQRILLLYHVYRCVLGSLLVIITASDLHSDLLRTAHPDALTYLAWAYFTLTASCLINNAQPKKLSAILLLTFTDIILLSAVFFFAGGINSGAGNLLIISVALGNILIRGRIGLLLAAFAASALIYLTFYLSIDQDVGSAQFAQAGILGALCFAAAFFVQHMSLRLQSSEKRAQQHAQEAANLEQLNSLILHSMGTGVLLINAQRQILLHNPAATHLIGQPPKHGQALVTLCPAIYEAFSQWLDDREQFAHNTYCNPNNALIIKLSFVELNPGIDTGLLIFLDDITQLQQHAQQLKLAALGRLTAGIAHEIRNPLGAISHAAQLLLESDDLESPDARLAQIIQDQSRRMNLIIENVLQLSRKREAETQLIDLKYWTHRFVSELRESLTGQQQIHINSYGRHLQTHMDPQQLMQVLGNLVQNGLRFSAKNNANAQVWLHLYRDETLQAPILDIIDDGAGVSPQDEGKLFEPFFTTDKRGTGLGLYISRELCESNHANLSYHTLPTGGACMRIRFSRA